MINYEKEKIKEMFKQNELVCERITGIISLISSKIRFRILCTLYEGDFCVSDIHEIINLGKISNLSQQLKILTLAGILTKKRNEKKIIYHLEDEQFRTIIQFLHNNFLEEKSEV